MEMDILELLELEVISMENVVRDVEIIPLSGIKLDGKMIALADSKDIVDSVLGKPCGTWKNSWFYFNNELRFDFDQNGNIEFIEFLAGIDGSIQPGIYGVSAFQMAADDLFNVLAQYNSGDILDNENGYSYGFINISVGVFRDRIPDDVQDMIEEAEEDGEAMEPDDIEYERKKANHWATIGIGIENYYR